jgi:hypothetical protein
VGTGLVNGGLVGTGLGLGVGRVAIGGLPAPAAVGAIQTVGTLGLARPLVAARAYAGPIPAAIQSIYTQEVLPVQTVQEPVPPQIIEVGPNALPVVVHFQSQSSPVQVEQSHIPGAPGEVQVTRSEDEPHRVVHEVVRPVIQEVREIIQPYRRIVQEIRPVEEEINSIVARGEGIRQQVVAAPAPVAAPVAVAGPIAAPVAVAQPITTSIVRQPLGLVGAGVVAGGPIVNTGLVGSGLIGAQRVLGGPGVVRKYVEYA